jgi:hypothetical protein
MGVRIPEDFSADRHQPRYPGVTVITCAEERQLMSAQAKRSMSIDLLLPTVFRNSQKAISPGKLLLPAIRRRAHPADSIQSQNRSPSRRAGENFCHYTRTADWFVCAHIFAHHGRYW